MVVRIIREFVARYIAERRLPAVLAGRCNALVMCIAPIWPDLMPACRVGR